MNNQQDVHILEMIADKANRNKGYALLIDVHQKRLYYFIRRMLLNHDDTNDVLQETFVRVFKAIENFRGESTLSTWMHSIAYRESLTFIERKKKRVTIDWNDEVMNNSRHLEEDVHYSGDAMQRMLQAMVAALPEKQRAVFVMKYYEEKKYDEIAAITGTSVGALKASYHHAVEKIKQAIEWAELEIDLYRNETEE